MIRAVRAGGIQGWVLHFDMHSDGRWTLKNEGRSQLLGRGAAEDLPEDVIDSLLAAAELVDDTASVDPSLLRVPLQPGDNGSVVTTDGLFYSLTVQGVEVSDLGGEQQDGARFAMTDRAERCDAWMRSKYGPDAPRLLLRDQTGVDRWNRECDAAFPPYDSHSSQQQRESEKMPRQQIYEAVRPLFRWMERTQEQQQLF